MNRTDGLRWDYAYDSPDYNWRQLRVINSTHDFSFTQFDGSYMFDKAPPGPSPGSRITPETVMPGVNIVGGNHPNPCGPGEWHI